MTSISYHSGRMNYQAYRDLVDVNSASRHIRNTRRILLYGKCVRDEYPDIFNRFANGMVTLAVCPEREHFNIICLKLTSIIARVNLKEVTVLTIDGSPHCIQLHHIVEEARKTTNTKEELFKHYVIENSKVVEISVEEIKTARYLSKIKRLLQTGKS